MGAGGLPEPHREVFRPAQFMPTWRRPATCPKRQVLRPTVRGPGGCKLPLRGQDRHRVLEKRCGTTWL